MNIYIVSGLAALGVAGVLGLAIIVADAAGWRHE